MTVRARWPFAARVLVVSAALAALLAAAIIMLVVGRAVSVPAASSKTHTTLRRITPGHRPALNRRNGAPFLPAGLPTKDIGSPPGRFTAAERHAQTLAVARERAVAARLAHSARLARILHVEVYGSRRGPRRTRHRGYNRRSLRP